MIRARLTVPERADGRERGFALVGVVMFVLALIILGLSLFSLSGYEAQFMENSYSSSQAFYCALGGLEHAKFVIAREQSLDLVRDVSLFPTSEGTVYYARARRLDTNDTTGTIVAPPLAPGTPIELRVAAEYAGQRRMVQAQYLPLQPQQYYKRLFTSREGIFVYDTTDFDRASGLHISRYPQTYLSGSVRETLVDPSESEWDSRVSSFPYGRPVAQSDEPIPDVTSFFDAHWSSATDVPNPTGATQFTLDAAPGGRFYRSDLEPSDSRYSVYVYSGESPPPQINVTGSGAAIWMLSRGFRSDQTVNVVGSPGACLVIVAHKNLDYEAIGPWFFAGFNSLTVPVILVSDDEVRIEQNINAYGDNTIVANLCVFARHTWICGPRPGCWMRLVHDPNSLYDQPGGLIDQLCELGALPNSGTMSFRTVPRKWAELDPDYPPN